MKTNFQIALRVVIVVMAFISAGCPGEPAPGEPAGATGNTPGNLPVYGYEVVGSWTHDREAYTQGLVIRDGALYESTGLNGKSTLRRVSLESGEVFKKIDLARHYFAEGITILNDRIYQLTWVDHKGFIYDRNTFEKLGEFSYDGEGWGLTDDNKSLILSDGTSTIRFIDPESFHVTRTIEVTDNNRPLKEINELEYMKGEIFANVWHDERIARIDPATGKVTAWIDLRGLRERAFTESGTAEIDQEKVLNGIAYDQAHDKLYVTGKLWPRLFEIKLVKR
ncbi:MAG: glutaminyl-peptide cyclotransferase [Pyrinomonadaceae bacterium]